MVKPFFQWLEDWQLDLDCLDKQHHQIVSTINKLHHALVRDIEDHPNDRQRINRHLYILAERVRSHFKVEEYLMRIHEYPEMQPHRREHRFLMAELQACIRDHEANRKPFNLETLTALKHWQINHVIGSDMAFAKFLGSQSKDSLEKALQDFRQSDSQTG
ncbi:MAG: bacteriohemerythrin [Candidatus Thiodiazotropha sp.]